jgi:hypothetical protein
MANQISLGYEYQLENFQQKKSKPRHACRNLIKVKIIGRETSKPRQIPKCLVLNARSLAKLILHSMLNLIATTLISVLYLKRGFIQLYKVH